MEIPFLAYVAHFSMVMPTAVGLVRFKDLKSNLQIIFLLSCANLAASGLDLILNLKGMNNLWISHFYGIVEFFVFSLVFQGWQSKAQTKAVFRLAIAFYCLFWIFAKIFLESLDQPDYYTALVSKIFLTLSSIYLLHRLSGESQTRIYQEPRFWVLSSVLVGSSGNLLYYSLREAIDALPREGLVVAYSVYWVITILANLLLSIGFLCRPPARNSGGQLELAQ